MANDRFTFEGHFHLEDDELKKALEDAKKRVASLSEELDQANQKLGFFQDKFEETVKKYKYCITQKFEITEGENEVFIDLNDLYDISDLVEEQEELPNRGI